MADPYSLKGLRVCSDFAAEIARLTKVLGSDFGWAQARAAKTSLADFVFASAELIVSGLIPGMEIVRRGFRKGHARGEGCRA